MDTPLTLSVVGGGAGGMLSLQAADASPSLRLVGLADLRPTVRAQAAEKFAGLRTYETPAELFSQSPTDVVCVSTYPPSHEEITLQALELPLKAILVEKPLGHTAASGRRILDAVKAKRLPLAVPHGLIVNPCVREIIRLVRQGEIGELKLVEAQSPEWDIINAGIHWFHFFLNVVPGDPVRSVTALCDASARTFRDGMQVETSAVTHVQTRSGVRMVLETGDYLKTNGARAGMFFRFYGTLGQIEYFAWSNQFRILSPDHPRGEQVTVEPWAQSPHRSHLENLLPMIRAGQPDYTLAETSLAALEICEAAYLSSRWRQEIAFPLADFRPAAASDWEPGQPYAGSGGGRDGRAL